MPDWNKIVGERLADLSLEDRDREEVVAELAGHLEETWDELRREGISEREAFNRALSGVRNWKDLQRSIYSSRKENTMTPRAARLWFPSLVTLVSSLSTMILFGFLGLNPGPLALQGRHHGIYLFSEYTVWLMALPFVGALGAYISERSGGNRRAIVFAGVFPALAWATVLFLVLSSSLFREHSLEIVTAPLGLVGLLTSLVFAPAACLLIGVLPFLGAVKSRPQPID